MKAKLQEKYIPSSYKSQLFSNKINLKQMTLSVVEYSTKFEEAKLRCSEFYFEDQFAIYTHFVNDLVTLKIIHALVVYYFLGYNISKISIFRKFKY